MRVRLFQHSCFAILCVSCAAFPAFGQDADSAKNFVESLYKLYTNNGTGVPYSGTDAARYYHSSLIALIAADEKAVGPGNVGVLDGDPVCSCQDWEGVWGLKVDVQLIGEDRALADVSFALSAPKNGASPEARHVEMTLVPESGQWRIWNIVDDPGSKSPFDLRKALSDEIRSQRPQPKH